MIPRVQILAVLLKLATNFALHEVPEYEHMSEQQLLDEFRRYVNAEITVSDIIHWTKQTNIGA